MCEYVRSANNDRKVEGSQEEGGQTKEKGGKAEQRSERTKKEP